MRLDPPQPVSLDEPDSVQVLRRITQTLSRSTHSDYAIDDRLDFIALFSPYKKENQLPSCCAEICGRDPARMKYQTGEKPLGFLRAPSHRNNAPHIFSSWKISKGDEGDTVQAECTPLPKRRHFLARNVLSKSTESRTDDAGSRQTLEIPIQDCTVDHLPFRYAQFSLFIPVILQHLEVVMVADKLRTTILQNLAVVDTQHICIAIVAPSAGWITDYQRYEFIGDTVLKFVVSHQLFFQHENWHEGYLSERKSRIVSNQRLAKGALSKGLDQYIITEPLKARKWHTTLISETKLDSCSKRNLSMKVVADVVEALIGAAYIGSGTSSAREYIHTFLPEVDAWTPRLIRHPPFDGSNATTMILKAESIVGYRFRNKILLVEALTHPSCDRDVQMESYQRLEFLGDAVLDMLVMSLMTTHQHATELAQGQMTLIRAALVNSNFLGFLCLDFSVEEGTVAVVEQSGGGFATRKDTFSMSMWSLLRHSNASIAKAQVACVERYKSLRAEIKHSLSEGASCLWLHLTRLNPDKFFSDMVESLIGAIFVDSGGSLAECHRFIDRIGLSPYMSRVLTGTVDISHPKTALEHLTGFKTVTYNVQLEEIPVDGEEQRYRCTVSVDGMKVANVTECLSTDEAIIAGASAARKNLEFKL
ncbi:hypothetical protein LTS18_011521 [Coniosporium uncinatum]|uniref:Uncharacterized protein n=1 Tax=Coniosporium uncinatum TaxID=93489 RepID=A0ACC3D9G7_9PEZI|nr:hypothetical protein LTS18_011521 [Coniosporium uncinatum]